VHLLAVGSFRVGPELFQDSSKDDIILQLRKRSIRTVLLAGMSANLCVDSHLREVLQQGFEVGVIADTTAAAKLPASDGMQAALTNFHMLASETIDTAEAVHRIAALQPALELN
ncbi:MAG: isochorismatase family protein, partial [Planctomycetales bacterium]|nr:isochorismatase family protein [Planctomycetales bacterium]